jgi:Reverse transcriptase (RNA-dependent DNA polymerase)
MKAGIRLFGEKGEAAVQSELSQLLERKVMEPMQVATLTYQEKKRALPYLMFLKEKRDGKIKGRGCADGRSQREYIGKEESSSPTVSTESVFLTSVIDARERRDVATVDLPGAFMQADMDDIVHMRLEGKMVDLLIDLDPTYAQFICMERGKKTVYVRLVKALYGTLKAAMLFWKKLTGILHGWGFETNPYDPCVANKMVNGKQCTIVWHVDDLKISHEEKDVVSGVIKQLEEEFGKEAPLTINRTKIHNYLGMTLDFSTEGKVRFIMEDYVAGILNDAPDDMDGMAINSAGSHLFDVNEAAEKLDQPTADYFHRTVARLLFLCKRARPDIQPAVVFLCSRVQKPDVDDYKKLARVIRYLRGTADMPLTLESDGANIIKWWADASFAVHPDMKSHTGGTMSLGKGAVYSMSTRQKINTKSSTEAELVGANDVMGQLLWTQYFLREQGYGSTETILYQDNKSAILLAENGRASSSKRTRHLNIRYFFITDRVADKDLTIEYCPTKEMLADYFTKPLQGALFRKLRDELMNLDPGYVSALDRRSVLGIHLGLDEVLAENQVTDSGEILDTGDWIKITHAKRQRSSRAV